MRCAIGIHAVATTTAAAVATAAVVGAATGTTIPFDRHTLLHTGSRHQSLDIGLVQLHPGAALEAARQHHGAIANADQAADRMTHGLEHAAHFAVAAFGDGHAVPAVRAFAATIFHSAEAGFAVFELHAVEQALLFFLAQGAQHAGRVFTLQAEAGVHQRVRQLARAGEQQQTFGIQVQTTDRLPLAMLQLGQLAEHRGAVLRIVMGDHLAHGIVIGDHARRRRIDAEADGLAVDLDHIAKLNALTDVSRLVVDRDAAFENQLLHLQARAHAGLGQYLVQLGRIDLRRQHTLGRHIAAVFLFIVKVTRDHIGKGYVLALVRLDTFLYFSAVCDYLISFKICSILCFQHHVLLGHGLSQLFSDRSFFCTRLAHALAGRLDLGSAVLLDAGTLARSRGLLGLGAILGLDHARLAGLFDRLGFRGSGCRLWHLIRCLVVHSGFPSGMTPSSSSTIRSFAESPCNASSASAMFLSSTASSSSTP